MNLPSRRWAYVRIVLDQSHRDRLLLALDVKLCSPIQSTGWLQVVDNKS